MSYRDPLPSLTVPPTGSYNLAGTGRTLVLNDAGQVTSVTTTIQIVPPDADDLGVFLCDEPNSATALVNSGSENPGATTNIPRAVNGNSLLGQPGGVFSNGGLRICSEAARFEGPVYSVSAAPFEAAISATNRLTVSAWYRFGNWSYLGNGGAGATGRPFYKQAKQGSTWSDPYYTLSPLEFWGNQQSYNANMRIRLVGIGYADVSFPRTIIPVGTREWFHVALTYDGTLVLGYVNGVEVARRSGLVNQAIDWDAHGPWVFQRAGTEGLGGVDMRDIRISRVARSAAYLLDMYERGVKLK